MITVIIKPTDGCNACCRYCSAAHPGAARRMTSDVLRRSLELFGDVALRLGGGRVCFIWHGGEPLLMPSEFWEEVLGWEAASLESRGIAVENRMQTNLTRLRREHIPFLKRLLGEHGVIGTSADPLPGIREIRGAPDGIYQEQWKQAVRLLADAGIRYGILYVVHRLSLPRLKEIYQGFRVEHPGVGLRFNPLYRQERARDDGVWSDLGITAEEWGAALVALQEAWTADGRPANVQPFGPWWELHARGRWRLSCECSGRCVHGHFAVSPEGDVYLCGRSADGGTDSFGNVSDLTAEALEDHPLRRALSNRIVYLRRTSCHDCRHWLYCHGGCVNDSALEHGTPFAPTSLCAGLRSFFERAFPLRGKEDEGCAA